jgi:hypothetical protein
MFIIYRSPEAMLPLRETWEWADDALRRAILLATIRVDQRLQEGAQTQGESRDDQKRVLFEAPLGVLFEADESKQFVRIVRCWAYRVGADVRDDME